MILKLNLSRAPLFLLRQRSSALLYAETSSPTVLNQLRCLAAQLHSPIVVYNQTRLITNHSSIMYQKMKEDSGSKQSTSIIQSEARTDVSTHHSPIKKGRLHYINH
jgi:hypothetical protein